MTVAYYRQYIAVLRTVTNLLFLDVLQTTTTLLTVIGVYAARVSKTFETAL